MKTFIIHFPLGFAAAWTYLANPLIMQAITLSFLAYEIIEDWRIQDKSFRDVRGFLAGLITGAYTIILFYPLVARWQTALIRWLYN